jgi:hypothetical protein
VIEEPVNAEIPKPNLENTYILLTINVTPAITPLVEEVKPTL